MVRKKKLRQRVPLRTLDDSGSHCDQTGQFVIQSDGRGTLNRIWFLECICI